MTRLRSLPDVTLNSNCSNSVYIYKYIYINIYIYLQDKGNVDFINMAV